MNSPVVNKPNELPPQSPREMLESAMAQCVMEIIQLRRTLWLITKQTGGTVVIDETKTHPLWRMKATRLPDGKMQLEAMQLPDPTEEQLATLAEALNGSRSELGDAMEKTELKDHPPAYIEKCLKDLVVRRPDGYWVDAKLHKISESEPPLTLDAAQKELSKYIGVPMCQNCKWKLDTEITDNCGCCVEETEETKRRHEVAFNRARELQVFISAHNHQEPIF